MVSIARALSRSPKIRVLDEPTSALTEREVDILFRKLLELKEQGISAIYITHKLKEVMYLADRISVLRDGERISTQRKSETNIHDMIEKMVNRKIENIYPKKDVQVGRELFRVEGLTVTHPQSSHKFIVEDVSFHLKEGEILGLVGLVGAGRSEIVNSLFGSIKKYNGRTFLEGKEVHIKSPKRAIRLGLALLTEDRKKDGFISSLNVENNCTLASLRRISAKFVINRKNEKTRAIDFIRKIKIKVSSEKAGIMSLSGGNQQKVVLSKWLMTTPKVLFLDEPTRGIDVGAKEQIYELMCDIAAEGKGIVFISSELPELIGLCDRFIVLGGGKVTKEFKRGEADEEALLHHAVNV